MSVADRDADENGLLLDIYISINSLFSGEMPLPLSSRRPRPLKPEQKVRKCIEPLRQGSKPSF
jgi:hypothetical protein